MAKKATKTLGKKELVKREVARLMRVFGELKEEILETLLGLIQNAAYMAVCVAELQELIDTHGYVEVYQNGENQSGIKQSEYVKMHQSYSKLLESSLKELVKYAPPKKRKETFLSAINNDEDK